MLAPLAAALLVLGSAQSATVTDAGGRIVGRVVSTYPAGESNALVVLQRLDRSETDRRTTTDGNGRFTFDRVAEGRYVITAEKPGYTSRRLSETEARIERGVELSVRRGQQASGVEVRLWRAASLAGRVIRSEGAAAPGIHVVLARRQGRTVIRLSDTQVTTAWDGRYTIAGLPPGEYLVLATGVGRTTTIGSLQSASPEQAAFEINTTRAEDFTPTLYPGVPASDTGATVTVLEGVVADGIDIWLTPARRFSISGRVMSPQDATVQSVTIEYGGPSDRRASIWTVSDPGGLFTIDSVAPGTVVLMAVAESNKGRLMATVSTDVRADDVEDLTIALQAPGAVEGSIAFPSDLPASARPGTIVLTPTRLRVSPLYPAPQATLASDGAFRVTNALGEYEIAIPGLPPGYRITSINRGGQAVPRNRIGVASNELVSGIVVMIGR